MKDTCVIISSYFFLVCIKFVDQAKNKIPLNNIISNRAEVVCYGYNLRSGITKTLKTQVRINCFSNFVTMLFSWLIVVH